MIILPAVRPNYDYSISYKILKNYNFFQEYFLFHIAPRVSSVEKQGRIGPK